MDSIIVLEQTCKHCGNQLTGRSNKKYCSDRCKNAAHYQDKSHSYFVPLVRNVTNALLKNRSILQKELDSQATVKMTKNQLEERGFSFKYFTNTFSTGDKTYFYCYDFGYMPLKDEWFLIVRLNK